MRNLVPASLVLCLALTACGKPEHAARVTDPCAGTKGTPPYETDAQAVQACRDNKKFSGQDAKRSNIQITNH
jgi:hypothetical protein